MKKRTIAEPIDESQLANGYLFPELFADEPALWRSQVADDSPFQPTETRQLAMPDMPPIDYDHIRRKDAEKRRARRRTR